MNTNYAVFYRKKGYNNMSFIYTFGLQQVLDFYFNFIYELESLYVTLIRKNEEILDTHVTIIEHNKSLVGFVSIKDLKSLIREVYQLDNHYILP